MDFLKKHELNERLLKRLKKPFSFEVRDETRGDPHPATGKQAHVTRFRISDANDDPVARTHEFVYAKEIVDALNHTCSAEHEWTFIAPEVGEPPFAVWLWCIRCGSLKLGDEKHDPIFTPGRHQKSTIVEDKK
jgi:hypothetical protein